MVPAVTKLTLLVTLLPVWSNTFLVNRPNDANPDVFDRDVKDAMASALGCGGAASATQLGEIRKALMPTWTSLPKNVHGQIDRSSFRYLARRYFSRFGIVVRGFEATRVVNGSHWGAADVLSERVPGYVESVLESQHAQERGFSLDDGVTLIATILQLLFDSESATLAEIYWEANTSLSSRITHGTMVAMLEDYIVHWLVGEDKEALVQLLHNDDALNQVLPRWESIQFFLAGEIRRFRYRREQQMRSLTSPNSYSFEDVHDVVSEITRSFASFWESECDSMKMQLVDMDARGTGRVPLSKFYGTSLDSEWRFSESEAYLRELGALDETSPWHGKEVIISNYIQGTSNCIVSTSHFRVCCLNMCEHLLTEIETALESSTALPSDILRVVATLVAPTSIDDVGAPNLPKTLITQLEQIADTSDGAVPLHGRLFQQWLHYVFPRECVFPHKAGLTSSVRPVEYEGDFHATDEEKHRHANGAQVVVHRLPDLNESMDWMSQWSSDEELFAEIRIEGDPLFSDVGVLLGGVVLVAVLGAGLGARGWKQSTSVSASRGTNSHFV